MKLIKLDEVLDLVDETIDVLTNNPYLRPLDAAYVQTILIELKKNITNEWEEELIEYFDEKEYEENESNTNTR